MRFDIFACLNTVFESSFPFVFSEQHFYEFEVISILIGIQSLQSTFSQRASWWPNSSPNSEGEEKNNFYLNFN